MTRRSFPWSRLGIDPTSDKAAIRKAYADVLRSINPDEDIAGFAELRRARDQALWLADQGPRDEPNTEADEGELYGLGGLDDDADDADLGWDDDAYEDDGAWDISPAFTPGERPAPAAPPELTEAQQRAQEAWEQLLWVLYPCGEPSETAVSHREYEIGLTALGVLTARAEEADLEEHDALDGALADLFARTWPRSAPFVEPANAAFRWLDESGSLEERPALRFLNQRLKGMRFHDKVQQPDHPLHKAWEELSRPGRAGMMDRLRVNRLDVHKLLLGIRERYPELESYLDPQRVASWEGAGAGSAEGFTGASRGLSGSVIFVILFFALIRAMVALGGTDSDTPSNRTLPPPAAIAGLSDGSDGSSPSKAEISDALIDAQLAITAPEVFGPGTDLAALRKADPTFVDQWRLATGQGSNTDAALAFVRFRAVASGEVAAFDELVVRGNLRALWMRAALAQSQEVCRNIMVGDFASVPLKLDEKERAREQKLLRQLLDAKLLSHRGGQRSTTFDVPGWAIDKMIKKSGLGIDELSAALKNPDHPKRCLVDLTLAEVVLAEPGRGSAEVLRAL